MPQTIPDFIFVIIAVTSVQCVYSGAGPPPIRPSVGCSAPQNENLKPGQSMMLNISIPDANAGTVSGSVNRSYWIVLPKPYSVANPSMLIISLHGYFEPWSGGDAGEDQMKNDGMRDFILNTNLNVVVAYPVGSGSTEDSNNTFSWNVDGNGLNTANNSDGYPTCKWHNATTTSRPPDDVYPCFTSCTRTSRGCNAINGCNFAACVDDGLFLRMLGAKLQSTVCVDTNHVHLSGFSTGGIMALSMGTSLPNIASVASTEGGRILGYNNAPARPISYLDVHGTQDSTMPANYSCGPYGPCGPGPGGSVITDDGFYMTPVANITTKWATAANCSFSPSSTYVNNASSVIHCVKPHGDCDSSGAVVVACTGNWSHEWPLHKQDPVAYPKLVIDFFRQTPLLQLYSPPLQTANQIGVLEKISVRAHAESIAAYPRVLELLDDVDFRSKLKSLSPDISAVSSSKLLSWWTEELDVVEIAHGMLARDPTFQLDSTELMQHAQWFPNQWQLPFVDSMLGFDMWRYLSYYPINSWAEINIFGFWPFNTHSQNWVGGFPSTLEQASDRPVYGIPNIHKLALPAGLWGDVSFVFNSSYVRKATILTPFDTGDFSCQCGVGPQNEVCSDWKYEQPCRQVWCCQWSDSEGCTTGFVGRPNVSSNCSVSSQIRTGVIDAVNHLVEPYAYAFGRTYAADRLAIIFARALTPWELTPHMQLTGAVPFYFEADVAANAPLPTAVKFIVLSFSSLFGSVVGDNLRKTAITHNWPVMWALGPNLDGKRLPANFSWPSNQRLVDPEVIFAMKAKYNISLMSHQPTCMVQRFQSVWDIAAKIRGAMDVNLSPTQGIELFANLTRILTPAGLALEPVKARHCQRPDDCIGLETLPGSRCVCLVTNP